VGNRRPTLIAAFVIGIPTLGLVYAGQAGVDVPLWVMAVGFGLFVLVLGLDDWHKRKDRSGNRDRH